VASIRRLYRPGDDRGDRAAGRPARPTGLWQVRYRDGGGRERGQSFVTEREAKAFRSKVETELTEDAWVDPSFGEVRLAEWLALWRRARVVSRTTKANEDSLLRTHVEPAFAAMPLRGITKLRVQTWIAELEQAGLSPATIAKCYRLLATVLATAVEEGLLRMTPCRQVRLPRAGSDERVFMTAEQVARVLARLPERYLALVLVAYLTGMRWSELAGLRVHRLDLLRARLEVVEVAQEAQGKVTFGPPKSRASRRVITLPPAAVDALAAHLARWPAAREDLVFRSPRGGPLSRTRFRSRVWATAVHSAAHDERGRRLAGWEQLPTFHALRHGHVAALIADGAPLKAVQQRLGHGSIKVTYDAYGHLEDSVDEALLDGLQRRSAQLMPPHHAAETGSQP
jgi:integrase